MSAPITLKTLAFFGATGDCAGHCLAAALSAGHTCNALARTPSKLTDSLATKGVSKETQDKLLTITQGDIRDVKVVERVLSVKTRRHIEEGPSSVLEDTLVDMIISGAGAPPQSTYSFKLQRVFQLLTRSSDLESTESLHHRRPKDLPRRHLHDNKRR